MENNEARSHKPKDEHEKEREESHQVKITCFSFKSLKFLKFKDNKKNHYDSIQNRDDETIYNNTSSNFDDEVINKGGSLRPLIVTQSEPDNEYEDLSSYTHYRL